MSKSKKQKKQEAAARRRQSEQERLRKAIEKQLQSPPPTKKSDDKPGQEILPVQAVGLPEVISGQPDFIGEDDDWRHFEDASLQEKISLFQDILDDGEMDEESAFEMLEAIRQELGCSDLDAGAQYAALVDHLRQEAPESYQHDICYYHENLVRDALVAGRWDALPELLAPFGDEPQLEIFDQVIEQLRYHGLERYLLPVMRRASERFKKGYRDYFEWAIEDFNGDMMRLLLFAYLDNQPAPHADDPDLLEATAPYGDWKEGWLERFIPRLTASVPSSWAPDDFGPHTDFDQWETNLHNLLAEFVAWCHQKGIPYGRADMAWNEIATVLEKQMDAQSRKVGRSQKKTAQGKKRQAVRSVSLDASTSLIPRLSTLDKSLGEKATLLSSKPYLIASTIELLPAYLHFLTSLGLIHPDQMDEALDELKTLVGVAQPALPDYGLDALAMRSLEDAWVPEALQAIRNDPALVEARARPRPTPEPVKAIQPPKPGELVTYRFKVTYLADPEVWRVIEIPDGYTLNHLHEAIQDAVDFDNDHLYSFFMSNIAWDRSSAYCSPFELEVNDEAGVSAAEIKIRDLQLRLKQRFLYLFDYGDEHHFEVQLIGINTDAKKGKYPRLVEKHGKNPPQYPDWDEDEDWGDEDDEGEEE